MTTYQPIYSASEGYAQVRLLIKNQSDYPLVYNLRGVNDGHGEQMKPYGFQTRVRSSYQEVRDGNTMNPVLAAFGPVSDKPYWGLLKTVYYTAKNIYATTKLAKSDQTIDLTAYVTNLRAGIVKPKTNLYVEMGSIPINNSLNNKGWATTKDPEYFRESFIGPYPEGISEDDEAAIFKYAYENGIGLHFWGDNKGLADRITGDFFNFNVNLREIRDGMNMVAGEDTAFSQRASAGEFHYLLDGGGVEPRADFVNLTVAKIPDESAA